MKKQQMPQKKNPSKPALRKKARKAGADDVPSRQPFLKRLLFGEEKPDLTELESGSTTILDILSPTAVDTKSRDYIVVDGVFHAYLYITGYGYSTTVGSCWLAPLVEAGEGVSVSFMFRRQSKDKILSKIAQTTMINRSRMRDVGDTRQDYQAHSLWRGVPQTAPSRSPALLRRHRRHPAPDPGDARLPPAAYPGRAEITIRPAAGGRTRPGRHVSGAPLRHGGGYGSAAH